ncbi:MAG: cyclic nucleotide-binding domain-containing protein [Deltaproteobacteria bacterium]|nr:cyclic nucleotide-binding domain-containing protein [Deltaproteobacteria bacterium]
MAIDPNIVAAAKDRAEAFFSKGRYSEALAAYEKIKSYGEKDPRIFLRLGDIARKMDETETAIGYYNEASESFVKLGFIIKAIAVCKMITNIDPSRQDAQEKLAGLYGRQAGSPAFEKNKTPGAGTQASELINNKHLPRTPLFSDFREEEFLDVIKKVRSRSLPSGEYLFHEGDSGNSIFIVAEGEVEVIGRAQDSSRVILSRLKEGSIFGEFGFFLNSKRTTDIKAGVSSTILELTKNDLNEIISKHGRVEQVLFDFYKERIVDKLMALSEVFRFMTEADRKEIISRLSSVKFTAGSVIMSEGDKGDTMYLIKQGSVSVTASDKKGGTLNLTGLEAGDFFGEIALATNRPRMATVTASTDVELVVFSRPMIKDILEKYPQVKGVLERVIKERVVDIVKAREHAGVLI